MNYFDLVLGLIPMVLVGVTVLAMAAGLTLTTAVPVGGAIAAGLVGHALFVRAPVEPVPPARAE